jgi:hypothetical protein
MRPNFVRLVIPGAACALAFAAELSWGGPILGPHELHVLRSPAAVAAVACSLTYLPPVGGLTSGSFEVDGITYYTLLDPASCASCGGTALVLRAAGFWVMTRFTPLGCSFTIDVTILGSRPGPACLLPDTDVVLCGPVPAVITTPDRNRYETSVPLPGGCCIEQPAFLRIRLLSHGSCDPRSPFWFSGGQATMNCTPCLQFRSGPGIPFDDVCVDSGGSGGNYLQWAEADCCDATPIRHESWGRVKILYR